MGTQYSVAYFVAVSATCGCSVVWCQSQTRTAVTTMAEMTMAIMATMNNPRDFGDGRGWVLGSISPVNDMGPKELKISSQTPRAPLSYRLEARSTAPIQSSPNDGAGAPCRTGPGGGSFPEIRGEPPRGLDPPTSRLRNCRPAGVSYWGGPPPSYHCAAPPDMRRRTAE